MLFAVGISFVLLIYSKLHSLIQFVLKMILTFFLSPFLKWMRQILCNYRGDLSSESISSTHPASHYWGSTWSYCLRASIV